jgi:hypothetical protein
MLSISSSGSLKNTQSFLEKASRAAIMGVLQSSGKEGVAALSSATPRDSGRAASSWGFEVSKAGGVYTITWTNSDVENGFPVAIMLQYGHGTGTGGYISGRDFINPAMRPVFDRIADRVWKAVISA